MAGIEVIGTIKPKNNGSFPVAEAKDIQVSEDGKRLDKVLEEIGSGGGSATDPIDIDTLIYITDDGFQYKEAGGEVLDLPDTCYMFYIGEPENTFNLVKGGVYLREPEYLHGEVISYNITTLFEPASGGGGGGTTVTVNGQPVSEFNADTKVDKVPQANLLYGTSANVSMSFSPAGYAIPRYSEAGTLRTNEPINDKDAANKLYADTKSKLFKHTITIKFMAGDPGNDIELYGRRYQIVTYLPTNIALTEAEIKSKKFSFANGDLIVRGGYYNGFDEAIEPLFNFNFEENGAFFVATSLNSEYANSVWEMVQTIDEITDTVED